VVRTDPTPRRGALRIIQTLIPYHRTTGFLCRRSDMHRPFQPFKEKKWTAVRSMNSNSAILCLNFCIFYFEVKRPFFSLLVRTSPTWSTVNYSPVSKNRRKRPDTEPRRKLQCNFIFPAFNAVDSINVIQYFAVICYRCIVLQ
jgi:hypothetical protein